MGDMIVIFWSTFGVIVATIFVIVILAVHYPRKSYTGQTWGRVSCMHREGPFRDLVKRARRHHQAFHRSVFPCGGGLSSLIEKYPLCACYRFEGEEPIRTLVRKGWHKRGECPYPKGSEFVDEIVKEKQ